MPFESLKICIRLVTGDWWPVTGDCLMSVTLTWLLLYIDTTLIYCNISNIETPSTKWYSITRGIEGGWRGKECPRGNLTGGSISDILLILVHWAALISVSMIGQTLQLTLPDHRDHNQCMSVYSCSLRWQWYSLCLPTEEWPGWVDMTYRSAGLYVTVSHISKPTYSGPDADRNKYDTTKRNRHTRHWNNQWNETDETELKTIYTMSRWPITSQWFSINL